MISNVLSLLMLVGALVYAVSAPIKTRKVLDGWKPEWFKGTPEEFVARYRRQFRAAWFFLVAGVFYATTALLGIVLFNVPERWGDFPFGVGFLIFGGVGLWCRRILDAALPSSPGQG